MNANNQSDSQDPQQHVQIAEMDHDEEGQ
jgi:hypothetical protein